MQTFQVRKIMDFLRKKRKKIGRGFRIDAWADKYLQECFSNGQRIVVLTPWSLSFALKQRFKQQGNTFEPTRAERRLFREQIPEIINVFEKNGFRLDWWILLSRSYLNNRLIGNELEDRYKKMLEGLTVNIPSMIIVNLEDDILRKRIVPDKELIENIEDYISGKTLSLEIEKWKEWAKAVKLKIIKEQLEKDTKYQIAAQMKEGRIFMDFQFELGSKFLMFLLESPENIYYLTVLVPELKKRMITVLPYFPWRITSKG